MIKNHHVAKSIQDVAWGMFLTILKQKCELYNKVLIQIDKWFPSSQICSVCHHAYKIDQGDALKEQMPLRHKTYCCKNPECNNVMDRDYNAAQNILNYDILKDIEIIYHNYDGSIMNKKLALNIE